MKFNKAPASPECEYCYVKIFFSLLIHFCYVKIFIFQFRGVSGNSGAFAIMGAVDPESFDTLHSFSNAFEMPFVTPWFPEKNFGEGEIIKFYPYNILKPPVNILQTSRKWLTVAIFRKWQDSSVALWI